MAAKKSPTRRASRASRPYCYDCRKAVRSLIEHRTTAGHRATISPVQDHGPKGRHPYRPPAMTYDAAGHDAWYEEQYLATLPPSIDEVFPTEIGEPPAPAPPAERDHRPPPCERCGKAFRTQAGADWHRVHNRQCEKWTARKSRAA